MSEIVGKVLLWVGGLVIGFFLGIGISHADVFATAKNQAGGELILMTNQSLCDKGERAAIARGSDGAVTHGCWFYQDGYIFVTYKNGKQRMYDDKGWVINEKFKGTTAL